MTDLNNLRKIADQQLGGLTATTGLKNRILSKAEEKTAARARLPKRRLIVSAALGAACLLVMLAVLPKPQSDDNRTIVLVPEKSLMQSRNAGGAREEAQADVRRGVALVGQVTLQTGSDSMSETLFDGELDGDFSMLLVNDRVYRLLTLPDAVNRKDFGIFLDTVDEYSFSPALSTAKSVSNVLQMGEGVYRTADAVPGLVVADCKGQARLWQRACYGGKALLSGESLSDTLCHADQLKSIEWVNHGEITGEAAQELYALLMNGSYMDAHCYGGESVLLHLNNGFSMQLFLSGDRISACGTWYAPEFAKALMQALP